MTLTAIAHLGVHTTWGKITWIGPRLTTTTMSLITPSGGHSDKTYTWSDGESHYSWQNTTCWRQNLASTRFTRVILHYSYAWFIRVGDR